MQKLYFSLSLCLGFADGLHHTFKRTNKGTSTVKKWTGMKKEQVEENKKMENLSNESWTSELMITEL